MPLYDKRDERLSRYTKFEKFEDWNMIVSQLLKKFTSPFQQTNVHYNGRRE